MLTRALTLAHIVSLRAVGGVERCYCEFICTGVPQYSLKHHTILPRPFLAPEMAKEVGSCSDTVKCLKKLGPFHIPRFPRVFRNLNLKRILSSTKPDALVFWNSPTLVPIEQIPKDIPTIYYEHGASWFKSDASEIRHTLDHVAGIISNSVASKRVIELKWGQHYGESIKVCYNSLRPTCYPEKNERRSLRDSSLRLGVAGRMAPGKGFSLAIHALAVLSKNNIPARLYVAGTGSEFPNLKNVVKKLNLGERVKFLGMVRDMNSFFSRIDIFLCPSLHESFGLVCVEAMAHGVPVIATKVDGLPEVVSDNVTGLCVSPELPLSDYPKLGGGIEGVPEFVYDPDSDSLIGPRIPAPDRLAEAIVSLWEDRDKYRSLSESASNICATNFRFSDYVVNLLDSIYSIIKSQEL